MKKALHTLIALASIVVGVIFSNASAQTFPVQNLQVKGWMNLPGVNSSSVNCASGDVTAAMQTDLNNLSAAGGGRYQIPATQCTVGTSASLNIPSNVTIVGRPTAPGTFGSAGPSSYLTQPYTLLLGANGANPITFSSNSGMQGVSVVNGSFNPGTTMRSEITAVNAFAGTGISCSGSTDINVRDLMVIGFQTGIAAACDRMNFKDIRGDNTNTLDETQCNDACTMENVEAWPFATPTGGAAQYQLTNISNVQSKGGLIEISFASVPNTPIVTGDTIVIASVGGVSAANGRWTVTAVDTQDFTLNGSTFSGTYTSGGTALLNATMRHGAGVHIAGSNGSPWMSHISTFGYDVGLWYDNADGAFCSKCWIDNFSFAGNYDPGVIGLQANNNARQNVFSGYINSPGAVFVSDPGNGSNNGGSLELDNVITSLRGSLSGVKSIQINSGNVRYIGGQMPVPTGGTGSGQIYVSDASSSFVMTNVWNGNAATASFQSPGDCSKFTVDGITGPCSWSPTLYGITTAGSSTPNTNFPQGSYTVNSAGVVTAWGRISDSSFSGATGTAAIGALPVTNSSSANSTCSIGRASGFALTSGYTQLSLDIATNSSHIDINNLGSSQTTGGVNAANISSTPEIDFTCVYHQ